jgi:pteridine reductase
MQEREHADARPVALVTGAAIRVGAAITTALAECGYRVWIHHGRSSAPAAELSARLRARHGEHAVAGIVPADLTQPEARARMVATVLADDGPAGGRLDVLVNSAASFERGAFASRSDDDLLRVLQLNLVAPLSLVRAFAPAIATAGGSVVNIVDVIGLVPVAGHLDHAVAKAGLELATRALAVELAPVRVNAVAPGTVDWPTDPRFAEGSRAREAVLRGIPLGRIGTPEDVAGAVTYLVGARHVTGHCLVVDGGRTAAIGG